MDNPIDVAPERVSCVTENEVCDYDITTCCGDPVPTIQVSAKRTKKKGKISERRVFVCHEPNQVFLFSLSACLVYLHSGSTLGLR